MSKFSDFLVEEENNDLCEKMMKKYNISERRCLSIIEYLRMMDKLTEMNLERAINVINIDKRPVKENKKEKNIRFLTKKFDEDRKKSFETHKKYRNIFENFLKTENGKCPEGFIFNKKLGGCVPKGPELNGMDFPLIGKIK